MPEAEDFNSIEIPGDTTLWKTQNIPPVKVYLPLVAYEKLNWRILTFFFGAAVTAYFTIISYVSLKSGWLLNSYYQILLKFSGFILFAFIFVFSIGMLTRIIFDSAKEGPLLILDSEGLWDRRQLHASLPWHNIKSIKFQAFRGTLLVHLHLGQPIYVKSGVFRLGGALKSGLKSNVQVLISSLDQDDEKIAKVLAALVRKNGGKIEGYSAYASYQP